MNNRRTFLTLLGCAPVTLPMAGQEPSQPRDIFQAAYNNDIPRATELANQNPWIARLRSPDGRTPLHFAVEGGHAEMIFFLTQKGADLSAGPESPLLTAVDYPDHAVAMEMSQALLMNASDANAKRKDGRSALDLARARGYTDIVEMLVRRGAVYFGKRYAFDAAGHPYTAPDTDGLPQDLVNEFARLSHFDVGRVKHLAKLAPGLVHTRATWDESAIEAASHMGLTALAQFLADQGSPVSTCTATLLGLRDRVEALVKSDAACVREHGAHDIALLAYTAYGDAHTEIAEYLLRAGAGVHEKALGITTMHIAATKGYIELAEVLLSHGADVNEIGRARNQDVTPMAVAVRAKQDKMVEFLKSRGGRA